jgi:peptidoglycan/LPS O-acetylase OafA/YrhL
LSIGLTLLAAAGSWFFIEKRALRLKRAPDRRVGVESLGNIEPNDANMCGSCFSLTRHHAGRPIRR